MSTLEVLTFLVYLLAGATFILALKFLSSPRTARTGNQLGAGGMALVVIWTLATTEGMLEHWWIILVAGAVGAVIGVLGARRVPMTAMPQMVAIFNGAGGGAAAVVALSEFLYSVKDAPAGAPLLPLVPMIATLLGAVIGSAEPDRLDYRVRQAAGTHPRAPGEPAGPERHRRGRARRAAADGRPARRCSPTASRSSCCSWPWRSPPAC